MNKWLWLMVLLAVLLVGCAGAQTRALVAQESLQDLTLQVALVRAIEATPDPARTAQAVQALAAAGALDIAALPVEQAVRGWLGWDELAASERLLVDALAEALAADLAAAAPGEVPALAARWRGIAQVAAGAVLAAT
jgi:hypothetical protein